MKRNLKIIIILLFGLWLTDLLLFHSVDHMYQRMLTGQSGGKINYYLQKEKGKSVLIMGNSRVYNQLIPDSIHANAYNLGHAGMKQHFQTALLSILETKKMIPGTVILHLEPHEFVKGYADVSTQKLKYYYGSDSIVTQYINELSFYERVKYVFRSYRFNGQVLNVVKNFLQSRNAVGSDPAKGWEPIPATPRDSLNVMYSMAKNKALKIEPVDPLQFAALEKFISICKRNHIRLICVTSPQYYCPKITLENSGIIEKFLTGHKIEYLNFLKEPIPELNKDPFLWKDDMHLNIKGASIESKKIGDWIKMHPESIFLKKN